MELIRGISGIRGIVNQTLTDSVITNHSQAFSKLQIDGSILLARDSRSHGEEFIQIAAEALKISGREDTSRKNKSRTWISMAWT